MPRKKDTAKKIIKIVYFDEEAAQDYLDIDNGSHFDWSTDENKEKITKMILVGKILHYVPEIGQNIQLREGIPVATIKFLPTVIHFMYIFRSW